MSKSYQQMKEEFTKFYRHDVKQVLPQYNKFRKKKTLKLIAHRCTIFSMFAIPLIIGILVSLKMTPTFNDSLILDIIFTCALMFIILIIAFIFIIFIIEAFLGKNHDVESDFEMKLKVDLMSKFLSIFFVNSNWNKSFTKKRDGSDIDNFNEMRYAWKKEEKLVKKIRDTKVFNPFSYIQFDDMIVGVFKHIVINLYEANTDLKNFSTLCMVLLALGVFIFMGINYISFFFLIFYCILLVLFLKIPLYRPFRGVVVEMDMNKNFSGHTFFHDNSFGAKMIPFDKKKYQRVNLESVSFEDKYNVYSDNQIEARYLLTTTFMERIENLKFSFDAKYVRGAFKDGKLILAIHTNKDMFAMGSDFKDSDTNTFVTLYNEMISILKIVDELKLNQHLGL